MDKKITEQLEIMSVAYDTISEIRNKDGVLVCRMTYGDKSFVLKYFEKVEYRREIEIYRILRSLEIPTIQLIAQTDSALLMEDVEQSSVWRLSTAKDLEDPEIAVQIAAWYKKLHEKGRAFVASYGGALYDENDALTLDNIEFIKAKTVTDDNPVWDMLAEKFPIINERLEQAERTLTYNDFYYTNLIVAKDKFAAFMFDYNMLGKGYVYSDIRNVCSSLGETAKAAFLSAYGDYKMEEVILDDVANVIVSLYFACTKDVLPMWAQALVDEIKSGKFAKAVMKF